MYITSLVLVHVHARCWVERRCIPVPMYEGAIWYLDTAMIHTYIMYRHILLRHLYPSVGNFGSFF